MQIKTFDELRKYQSQVRAEGASYAFFVRHRLVTREEAVRLWAWFCDSHHDIADVDGHVRARLVGYLSPAEAASTFAEERVRYWPRELVRRLAKRAGVSPTGGTHVGQ